MRQGLFRPTPSWPPMPQAPPVHRGGVRHQLVIGLACLTVAFLAGLLDTGRGLLAAGLAWAVIGLLARHRADGGGRQWCKALTEYAVVGALVFAVLTAAPAAPSKAKPKPRAEASQADPWADLRDQAAKLWDRVGANAPTIKFPDQQGGR